MGFLCFVLASHHNTGRILNNFLIKKHVWIVFCFVLACHTTTLGAL